MTSGPLRDGLAAAVVASVLSGVPSTLHGIFVAKDPWEPTLAAGSMLLPHESRRSRLVLAAVPVHIALSLGWGIVLSKTLPSRRTMGWGTIAGALIALLDLGIIGKRFPRIKALPALPQIADHLAFGAICGWVISRRRSSG